MRTPDFAYNPIADAVHCASIEQVNGNNLRIKYGRGVLVGLIAGLMANRMITFEQACNQIVAESQQGIRERGNAGKIHPACVPDVHFEKALAPIIGVLP